jgi:hypothetical protein
MIVQTILQLTTYDNTTTTTTDTTY